MKDKIKITKDLDIHLSDLMLPVDVSQPFTLKDVLCALVSSTEINVKTMGKLVRCPHLKAFWDEAKKPKPKDKGNDGVEYLQVYWFGEEQLHNKNAKYNQPQEFYSSWNFDGKGKMDEHGCNAYGLSFSPLNELAHFPVQVNDTIQISRHDFRTGVKKKDEMKFEVIKFRPHITLIELLHAITWELGFYGSPKERDKQGAELSRRVDDIKQAEKDGKLDELMVPMEDVFKDLKKKLKKKQK